MDYQVINGIKCYAPELAFQNENFSSESFEYLYNKEEKHFWFVSRNQIILDLFKKYLGKYLHAKILEIGCGAGFVLKVYETFPSYQFYGSEIYLNGIQFAKKRLPNNEFIQLDATCMPFENEFHAVGAFDVIEHIEEDELVIQQVHKSLKMNGYFFITVPQYMWMWSETDEAAHHKRRYTKIELKSKLEKAGFKVLYQTSFVFSLFPVMILSRFLMKLQNGKKDSSSKAEFEMNPVLNQLFSMIMKVDVALIRKRFSLPFGGSLVMVAEKVNKL